MRGRRSNDVPKWNRIVRMDRDSIPAGIKQAPGTLRQEYRQVAEASTARDTRVEEVRRWTKRYRTISNKEYSYYMHYPNTIELSQGYIVIEKKSSHPQAKHHNLLGVKHHTHPLPIIQYLQIHSIELMRSKSVML